MLAIDRGQPGILQPEGYPEPVYRFPQGGRGPADLFEIAKAKERAHILEGLTKALEEIDEVIAVIKRSGNPQEAAAALCGRFGLTDVQAKAILEMRLQRLTALEREVEGEWDLINLIGELQAILDDPQKVLDVIVKELQEG